MAVRAALPKAGTFKQATRRPRARDKQIGSDCDTRSSVSQRVKFERNRAEGTPIYELAWLATCLVYRLLVPKRPVQIETVLPPRSFRSMPTLRGKSQSKSRSRTSTDGDRRDLQEYG